MTTSKDQPTLNIDVQMNGRTQVLSLAGCADLSCVNALEVELTKASAKRPQHVLIDMPELKSIPALLSGTL